MHAYENRLRAFLAQTQPAVSAPACVPTMAGACTMSAWAASWATLAWFHQLAAWGWWAWAARAAVQSAPVVDSPGRAAPALLRGRLEATDDTRANAAAGARPPVRNVSRRRALVALYCDAARRPLLRH